MLMADEARFLIVLQSPRSQEALDHIHDQQRNYFVAYSVGYGRLLNEAVAAISSQDSASSIGMAAALRRFEKSTKIQSHIVSLVLAIIVTVGDTIVWWRVCILWRKKLVLALGAVLMGSTFVFGIVSAIHEQIIDDIPPLLAYGDVYGGISTFLSLLTNVIATSLIGRTAWKHRKLLRQCPDYATGRWSTPTMKVLTLLLESGVVYSVILLMAMIVIILLHSKLAGTPGVAEFLSRTNLFFTGCFAMILAIYPTIIIFIVALNRSPIEGGLANATTNGVSVALLPSIVFGSTSSNGSTSDSESNLRSSKGELIHASS
ncbi:hypothetical protein V8D89_004804 [Ganoderma adspersum]